ncbi:MAG: hypothetical protein M3Y87_24760 [Myxococcota bacterium]|nr:hypothetical protein [Myxococcota bacterium]
MEHIEEHRGPIAGTYTTTNHVGTDYDRPRSTISWRAVLAGVVVALAAQILLTTLGLAIGATTLDANASTGTLRDTGIGVGVWYLISTLISVFCGGMVAGISARELTKTLGSIEGLLVWALSLLLTIWFVTSGVQSVIAQASGMIAVDPAAMQGAQMPNLPQNMQLGEQTAQQLTGASTAASWIAFGTLLLSAIAGVLGGIVGSRLNRKQLHGSTTTTTRHEVPAVQTLRPTEA